MLQAPVVCAQELTAPVSRYCGAQESSARVIDTAVLRSRVLEALVLTSDRGSGGRCSGVACSSVDTAVLSSRMVEGLVVGAQELSDRGSGAQESSVPV